MKQKVFWQELESRLEENSHLVEDVWWKRKLSPLLIEAGLDFWKIGLLAALLGALAMHTLFFEAVVLLAKELLWL